MLDSAIQRCPVHPGFADEKTNVMRMLFLALCDHQNEHEGEQDASFDLVVDLLQPMCGTP